MLLLDIFLEGLKICVSEVYEHFAIIAALFTISQDMKTT